MRKFLAFLSALLLTTQAHATILWTGAEDLEFSPTGAATLDQTSGHFRSGWGRGDLQSKDSGSNNANATFWTAANIFSQTSFWVSARVYLASTSSAVTDNRIFALTGPSGEPRLMLTGQNGASFPTQIQVKTVTTTGTTAQIGSNLSCTIGIAPSVPDKLDMQVISYGASGTINIYINGGLCYSFTGNIQTNSIASLNGIQLGSPSGNGSTDYLAWSEIIVATTDTRSMGLVTMAPSGNGNTQAWSCTSGTYASVNAWNTVAAGDLQNCNSGTSTQVEEFTWSGTLPTGNYFVNGVVSSVRSDTNGTGPGNLQHVVRTGGTDYTSSSQPQTGALLDYQNVWSTNPNTSANWATSDLTAGGFNFGMKSQP